MSLSVRSSSTGFTSVRVIRRDVRSGERRLQIPLEVTFKLPLVVCKARGRLGTLTVTPPGPQAVGSPVKVYVEATFKASDTGSWSGVLTFIDAAKKEYKIELDGVKVSDGNVWAADVVV